MKLWLKIYLFTLLLLICTLNISGILLIQRFHNNVVKQEIDKCLEKQDFVTSELNLTALLMDRSYITSESTLEDCINQFVANYIPSNSTQNFYQILKGDGTPLYQDAKFPMVECPEELSNLSSNQTTYIIRFLGNRTYYLYMASNYNVFGQPITLYCAKNISSIYTEKYSYYAFFIKLDLFICCTFAFFMFFISRLITQPIRALTFSTREIASGKFSERIPIHTHDEFGCLSKDFNSMAETIEDKINQLEYANAAQKTFINNFTHELKTPLTSIIGYANLLRSSRYNEKLFVEAADYIYKESKHLEKVSLKIMDLIYARESNLEFVPIDILQLLSDVKAFLKPKLEEKEIELTIQGEPYIFLSDQILMHMLLSNLIENAIKASDVHSTIEAVLENSPSEISLSIIDHGIGIPAEHLAKLCEPFYMVDKSRSRKNHGAGIGLSICKEIANLHHIELIISSEFQKGTTVKLVFSQKS